MRAIFKSRSIIAALCAASFLFTLSFLIFTPQVVHAKVCEQEIWSVDDSNPNNIICTNGGSKGCPCNF